MESESVSFSFTRRLKTAIWRPRKKPGVAISAGKVSLRMPKLHTMLAHVSHFVRLTGFWGFFSEESFEHCQQTYKYLRMRHSHNVPAGVQLSRDLHFAWLRSLPAVSCLQSEAEDVAFQNNKRLRKRKYGKDR